MKQIEIDEIKEMQLAILDNIDSYCKRHNLRYFLAYGTLLGAVRHKGYIPWDDDIDIHMLRPDYEKFIADYNNQSSNYRVIENRIDSNYTQTFAKVHDTRTQVIETKFNYGGTFGIYIDIFPLDPIESPEQIKKVCNYRRLLDSKAAVIGSNHTLRQNITYAIKKLLLLPLSRKKIVQKINRIITKGADNPAATHLCSFCSYTAQHEQFPREMFQETIPLEFEQRQYPAPRDYHTYLQAKYGNYMQLPPKEKQVTHHYAIITRKEQQTKPQQ